MFKSEPKYLKRVYLDADVYSMCLQHALLSEKEEIMGLLIGEVDEFNNIAHIHGYKILHRSDKQPDRVEISPEQLSTASAYAEELTKRLNCPMNILGWYHSHPHITVWPSHVDIRTQGMYQTMDPLFVGLIFSVYQSEGNCTENEVQLTCFQTMGSGANAKRRDIELIIKNSLVARHNLEDIAQLPQILVQEDNEMATNDQVSNVVDPLADLHNNALKTIKLSHVISKLSVPMCEVLEERLSVTETRISELQHLRDTLKKELAELN